MTEPPGDPQSFNFTLTGPNNTDVSFNLTDQDTYESQGLKNGTYNVTEFLPDHWELIATCSDGSDPDAIELDPGEIVTCNFTNVLVFVPAPSMTINKTYEWIDDADGSGDISAGDTIRYTYTVNNTGNVDLTNVTVNDDLLGTVTLSDVTGDGVGLLAVGDNETGTLDYVVQSGDLGTTIQNTGTGESDQTDPVTDDEDVPVPSPSKTIDKILLSNADEDGSGDVSEGDTLTYRITVTNSGTANLTNVNVSDDLTGNSTICALVIPGDTCVLTVTYVVQSSDLGTTIQNTGTGDSDQTDPVTDDEDVPVPSPSKTIDKILLSNADEDGSGDVSEGDTLTYRITVTNSGTANLTNVNVSDDLTGNSTICALVIPGDTCVLTVTYVVQSSDLGTTIQNTGTGESDQTDPVTDDEDVPVPSPSKTIDKILLSNADEDGSGDVSEGDTLTYRITVTNSGTANLTNVNVSDDLTGGSKTCPLVIPGATCVLEVTYVVNSSDLGTTINNTGTGDSDQTDPVTDDEDVPVPTPLLTIDKTYTLLIDADSSGNVSLDDTILYTITATNNGTANLTNVYITDTLLLTLSCTPAQPAFLAPTETLVCNGTYVVTTEDDARGFVTNTATADSTQTGPVEDTVTVPVVQKNQRSIEISSLTADRDGDGDLTTLIGDFLITDESENKNENELSVCIPDLFLTFEERVGNKWVPLDGDGTISCEITPPVPLIFGPDNPDYPGNEVSFSYNCTKTDSWPDKVKITVHAMVCQRDKEEFIYRDTFDFAKTK